MRPHIAKRPTCGYLSIMKNCLLLLLGGYLLSSCVPSTPQTRIQKNPEKFASLTEKHKTLVQQGEIVSGMPPAAVELAWGEPSRRFEGFRDRKASERWDYIASRPAYRNTFYGGFADYGSYGRYGRGRYSTLGLGFGPEIEYIPEHVASVWFSANRVNSWERVR